MVLEMYPATENNSGTVPAFLSKLWTLVEDRAYDDLISWGMNGKSFHVHDQVRFAKEILPLYFKHNNIASFIRQLNMYGFRKVINLEQGSLKTEKDNLQFQHNYFVKGKENLLELIKRKVPNVKIDATKLNPEELGKLYTDVKMWKNKQDHINAKLETMKRQNDALWREVASLRQKHKQQQQIVNKLIQLLVTFIQHNRGLPNVKRQLPRMIEDASEPQETVVVPAKRACFQKQLSIEENGDLPTSQTAQVVEHCLSPNVTAVEEIPYPGIMESITDVFDETPCIYPTIIELGENEEPQNEDNHQLQEVSPSEEALLNKDVVLSGNTTPKHVMLTEPDTTSQDLILINPEAEREALAEQLDSIQNDLDGLQGMLSDSSSTYNLDTNTLLSLFSQDTPTGWQDSLLTTFDDPKDEDKTEKAKGNELIAYPQEDLSSWLVDSPSASSELNDDIDSTIDATSLDTPDCNFDKDLDFPSSSGKRKSKRPMRIILS
ncbi:heat shock factor protein isoform X2 [Octopus sinensis]|uniref:Heat shock factor protein isoform X2 n=1 Tax=Octopus sinensis TaxID=2607531 RepID=A0A6P7SBI2_9MOLL|nr:heat shock factor protein isoform X2 [Octopus sinensis]